MCQPKQGLDMCHTHPVKPDIGDNQFLFTILKTFTRSPKVPANCCPERCRMVEPDGIEPRRPPAG